MRRQGICIQRKGIESERKREDNDDDEDDDADGADIRGIEPRPGRRGGT